MGPGAPTCVSKVTCEKKYMRFIVRGTDQVAILSRIHILFKKLFSANRLFAPE